MDSTTRIIFLLPLFLCLAFQPLLIVSHVTHNGTYNSTYSSNQNSTNTSNHNSTNTSNHNSTLLIKVCNQTKDKDFCYSSFKNNPDSEKTNDLAGLAMIALNMASNNASNTMEHIKILRNNSSLGPMDEQGLDDCYSQYLDAAEQLDDSVNALIANAYNDVRVWVGAAVSDVEACEKGFKQKRGKLTMLSHYNNVFRKLCHNVLVINNLLAQN